MNIFKFFLIGLIKIYKIIISPLIGNNCRYLPTCSEYFIDCLNEYGVIKGTIKGIKRILSCHPFGGQGYHPAKKGKN